MYIDTVRDMVYKEEGDLLLSWYKLIARTESEGYPNPVDPAVVDQIKSFFRDKGIPEWLLSKKHICYSSCLNIIEKHDVVLDIAEKIHNTPGNILGGTSYVGNNNDLHVDVRREGSEDLTFWFRNVSVVVAFRGGRYLGSYSALSGGSDILRYAHDLFGSNESFLSCLDEFVGVPGYFSPRSS